MTISEKFYFLRQLRGAFESIGAIIPTSHYAAEAMASECSRLRRPKHVLEVGSGTGSITAEVIKSLGPDDRLVLCEINPKFVAYLRQRFEQEPNFRRVRDQVTIHAKSITELDTTEPFDCIISAIPFTSCPPELTASILAHYQRILKPGGTLTYIEYAWIRKIKGLLLTGAKRQKAQAVDHVVDPYIASYQFRRDLIWRNVPPAWIRHLRFTEAHIEDTHAIAPRNHIQHMQLGPIELAKPAIPFLIGSKLLMFLLYRRTKSLWLLPFFGMLGIAWFFRDPVRSIAPDTNVVYSSCDGRVLSIDFLKETSFGKGEFVRIAVFLSLTNIHINRAPVAGKVVQISDSTGGYAAANTNKAESNQSKTMIIDGLRGRCIVVQRTGMVARRIVNWSSVGDLLAQGERFGLIQFGSRTDVYLPASLVRVCVAPGDRVQAGITVIARYTGDAPK